MAEGYNREDGSPNPRPDSSASVFDEKKDNATAVGERQTQENMAGQGTGQNKNDDEVRRRAGRKLEEEM
jgi:hypothetical protein